MLAGVQMFIVIFKKFFFFLGGSGRQQRGSDGRSGMVRIGNGARPHARGIPREVACNSSLGLISQFRNSGCWWGTIIIQTKVVERVHIEIIGARVLRSYRSQLVQDRETVPRRIRRG